MRESHGDTHNRVLVIQANLISFALIATHSLVVRY